MRKSLKLFALAFTLILTGCATQNVPIQNSFWKNKPKTITVAVSKLPTPGIYKYGNQGLVDILIADQVTEPFQTRLKHYNLNKFISVKADIINNLQKRGIKVINYKGTIDLKRLDYFNKNTTLYASKNFLPYRGHLGSDKLLLISLDSIGALRLYYGFVPLGAPKAICYAEARLIDLKTNRILWRQKAKIKVPVSGAWHQPPNYPNFINSLNSAVAMAKTQLLTNFFGN